MGYLISSQINPARLPKLLQNDSYRSWASYTTMTLDLALDIQGEIQGQRRGHRPEITSARVPK